ncbi:DNA polymerase III subunit gamma/tau [candidate division WOR-3 bacterium]|nr:DNA polymerase III subunit gamma/tau [candidate division WOR-3 bacterium]
MNHRVLSLKYRPQKFDELTGQVHIVLSLKGAINSGRIGHAFLFAGPRGVGKTTAARIFAKSLNCVEGPTVHPCQKCQSCREITLSRNIDVIEIDGASNNGVDEIRNLRETVQYGALHGKYRIYIIDEVHMLSIQAFNALLKTLEEPPPSVKFVLATTNQEKVPQTIQSRCERYIFKRLSIKEISGRLKFITEREQIKIAESAVHDIATRADGSVRDAESILEQLVSFVEGTISENDILRLAGSMSRQFYFDLMQQILQRNHSSVLRALNTSIENGAEPLEVYRGLVDYLRAALLTGSKLPPELLDLPEDDIKNIRSLALSRDQVMSMLEILLDAEDMIKRSMNSRVATELLLCRLIETVERPQGKPDNARPADDKQEILRILQTQSPKLAAVLQNSSLKVEGEKVNVYVENDFAGKMLLSSRDLLETTFRKIFRRGMALHVEVVSKNIRNDIEDQIKVLFDGEEVR